MAQPSSAAPEPRFRSWPITEVAALEAQLQQMGLRVPAREIDGTSGGALAGRCFSDALVSVGPSGRGGTGSFISADGLMITNHHVAFDAVRQASTPEKDYLTDGFVSRSRSEEASGRDYEVWITRACEDVSAAVLEVLASEPDPLKRANRVRDKKHEIATGKEKSLASKGLRCEVKEMFVDKTYVLFTFERLRDVRIVYVPPLSLGEFGGDTDNFEWPRHWADFTLLRAYVGPDGEPADPSPKNVPYKPSKFLKVSRDGVQPGDFVFLLGFPGHTMRYAPTARLSYADEVAVPQDIDDFARKLALIDQFGGTSRAVALKLAATRKSLANEFKRSRGKRVMMHKLGLLAERAREEESLREAIPESAAVLRALDEVYGSLRKLAPREAALTALRGVFGGSALLAAGHALHEAHVEAAKPDDKREESYRARNQPFLVKQLEKRLSNAHLPMEVILVQDACAAASKVGLTAPASTLGDVEQAVGRSTLCGLSAADLEAYIGGADNLSIQTDVFVCAAASVYTDYVAVRDEQRALLSERDRLLARLLEMQKANTSEHFYPDANGTLRISAGHVEGYQAADAVQHTPITTLAGLVEKHIQAKLSGGPDAVEFACPQKLLDMCGSSPSVASTPVNCCYSTDTVGGNSGSPVLNASGEFVAINFDRQRLGLMNEFKWSSAFSRSIGVDVRYILWLVGEYDSATHLIQEMVG